MQRYRLVPLGAWGLVDQGSELASGRSPTSWTAPALKGKEALGHHDGLPIVKRSKPRTSSRRLRDCLYRTRPASTSEASPISRHGRLGRLTDHHELVADTLEVPTADTRCHPSLTISLTAGFECTNGTMLGCRAQRRRVNVLQRECWDCEDVSRCPALAPCCHDWHRAQALTYRPLGAASPQTFVREAAVESRNDGCKLHSLDEWTTVNVTVDELWGVMPCGG